MHKGEILKSLIRKSSFTQKAVSKAINIDEKYFSTLLRDSNLRDEIVEKACEFIGVDFEEYFGAGALAEPEGVYSGAGIPLSQYFKEKGEWLEKLEELMNELKESNNKVVELTAENYRLKEKLNLGGLSKMG